MNLKEVKTLKTRMENFNDNKMINMTYISKLFILLILLMALSSCKEPSVTEEKTEQKEDSLDYKRKWANNTDYSMLYNFPNFFPELDVPELTPMTGKGISYDYYGFNEVLLSDSDETILRVFISRAWHPTIVLKIYKSDSLCFFESKMNSSDNCFGHLKFHLMKEISDSVFNSFFEDLNRMNFFNFSTIPIAEGFSDGSLYFIEVVNRRKYHNVLRFNPYYKKTDSQRPHQSELLEICNLCNRLFDLSGCKEVFEPIF